MQAVADFRESVRDMRGVTVGLERRVLQWLAPRIPARIHADHLTALAFAAMAGAGAAYAWSASTPWALWLVNLLLVVNWFGDSLDGTLARVRQQQRPRYGFYVDHVVDAAGAAFLLAGLAWSGYMSAGVATALMAAYFLVGIEIYLATYCVGRFAMSAGGVGGTELRLILIAMNAGVFWLHPEPRLTIGSIDTRVLDPVGVAATALLALTFAVAAARHTRQLFQEEPRSSTCRTR